MQFGKIKQIDRVYGERREREPSFVMRDYHYHRFYEIYYVERGSCQFFVGDSLYRIGEGSLLLIPPENLHYTSYRESCLRFSIYFRLADIDRESDRTIRFRKRFAAPVLLQIPSAWQGEIRKLLDRMEQEERFSDYSTAACLRLLLNELLLQAIRFGNVEMEATGELYSEDEAILRAARYISRHYEERLTQGKLATLSGYSPNYFSRRFREMTGIGAHEYLRLTRLRHAAALLRAGEQSVTVIALSVGFSDANYFKDAFKAMYGISPREYRRECRRGERENGMDTDPTA